jgi:signal transduction histidine kinase
MARQAREVSFKISSRTARMLGRQNVSNQIVAIIELIKNAYDADAPRVKVSFEQASTPDGVIVIEDNGTGMDEDAIEKRWLMIGTDYKEREPISIGRRIRTGAKGIGRFALDRLGDIGILETFTSPDSDGLRVVIDWRRYDDPAISFESVKQELETVPNPEHKRGTRVTIRQLRDVWTSAEYQALYEDLVFLVPPLESYDTGFLIELLIDENEELSGVVKPMMREAAEYELQSKVKADGTVTHTLRHRSGDVNTKVLDWVDIKPQKRLFDEGPACGPVEATVLFYLRDAVRDKRFEYGLTALRRYLDTFRGIRIYRDGFQVKPYGSKGNDWLGLDSRKQVSPEGPGQDLGRYKVSNNQLIGTVLISRTSNPGLQDRTSRESLIENEALQDLKLFLMNSLEFLELQRQLSVRREPSEREEPLKESAEQLVEAVRKLHPGLGAGRVAESAVEQDSALTDLPSGPESADLTNTVSTKVEVALEDLKTLEEKTTSFAQSVETQLREIQLLRALATVGIALATFAHEIKANVLSVIDETVLLRGYLQKLSPEMKAPAIDRLEVAISSAERIENWSNFVLERVKQRRRIEQPINIKELIQQVLQPFSHSFTYRRIKVNLQVINEVPPFWGFPIDYEAVLINLLTNSIKALERTNRREKLIEIGVAYHQSSGTVEISFDDSGRGIDVSKLPQPDRGVEQIFQPFVSAKDLDGTGMGLAVVDRIVHDLHGTITATAQGKLGGAHFSISLPLRTVDSGGGE